MTELRDLDDLIAAKMADADGDEGRLQDPLAALLAGVGLTIAFASASNGRVAGEMCERAAHQVFVQAGAHAAMLSDFRRMS